MASATAAGCVALPGARAVKLTSVHTQSAPVSKADLYYSAAVRQIEARDYARALDYLQTARGVAPQDVRVINAFGVIYDKLGRFDLSRRYYAEAKALEPASRIVANNIAYSDRLQGLSQAPPFALASATEPEAKPQPQGGLMPGSPVVVVPIASAPPSVIMVATVAPADAAPELFKPARRTQIAAAAAGPAVKPAAVQVSRVEFATAKPAEKAAATSKPTLAKAPAKVVGAPILLVDQSGSPDAAQQLGKRLAKLGWSVQVSAGSPAKPVEASRIDYPTRNPLIAHALARTLPGAVSVNVCAGGCSVIRLVVGKDARLWSLPKRDVSRS